ncbi:MAG: alginate lyase family protein [Anaerolineales bacterium]|jgi:hypothetical protein
MKPILAFALRELGPGALLRFGQYRLGLDTGWIRRQTPLYAWDDRPLSSWLKARFDPEPAAYSDYRFSSAPKSFMPPTDVLRGQLRNLLGSRVKVALASANQVLDGSFSLFGLHKTQLGFPPDWHAFAPLVDVEIADRSPPDEHWSEIDLLDLPLDVKLLWEPNRFGWIYTLARAYVISGEDRYFKATWSLIASWREANPPNSGLNWHSAQEVSIRLLALIFALFAMQDAFIEHPDRVVNMVEMIAVHAERIPPTLSYAIAQGNNHLLVEAAGLFTVGSLFPEFKRSNRWRRIGRRWLIRALQKQVFPDGGYIQHSVNYHRLALQAALWAASIAEVQGKPLPASTLDQLQKMTVWLSALVDRETGAAPNFGPNDGAEILPLSVLPFDDYRPTLQAASRLLCDKPLYPKGEWDEWGLWMGLVDDQEQDQALFSGPIPKAFRESGIHKMNGERARSFLRAGRFKSRPGHADQLHLDLWFGPVNIAMDAGTYLYNADPPWDNAFSGAAHHNTVLVDGKDAMIRAGRFLWLNWNQAHIWGHWCSDKGNLEVITAERFGDLEGEVLHRRTVIRAGDRRWRVIDDLLGDGRHRIDLSWLLPDLPWSVHAETLQLASPIGEVRLMVEHEGGRLRLVRAGQCVYGEEPAESVLTLGWYSPTYAYKAPALQLMVALEKELPLRIQSKWLWMDDAQRDLQVSLNAPADALPLNWVKLDNEDLEIDDAYSVDSSGICRNR